MTRYVARAGNYGLPTPPIKLDGFPVCFDSRCKNEVATDRSYCPEHGGAKPSLDILRRVLYRVIRTAAGMMLSFEECSHLDPKGIRCARCAFSRGALLAVAGLSEQLGWLQDVEPILKITCPTNAEAGQKKKEVW